jgi:hypothetical protein
MHSICSAFPKEVAKANIFFHFDLRKKVDEEKVLCIDLCFGKKKSLDVFLIRQKSDILFLPLDIVDGRIYKFEKLKKILIPPSKASSNQSKNLPNLFHYH